MGAEEEEEENARYKHDVHYAFFCHTDTTPSGFARRYFVLHRSGLLSYSFHPGLPTRDQVHLNQAAISSAPGRKDIHIDANNATFHIKCLSTEDFNRWMSAFRRFIAQDSPLAVPRSSYSRSMPRTGNYTRAGALIDEIGQVSQQCSNFLLIIESYTDHR